MITVWTNCGLIVVMIFLHDSFLSPESTQASGAGVVMVQGLQEGDSFEVMGLCKQNSRGSTGLC